MVEKDEGDEEWMLCSACLLTNNPFDDNPTPLSYKHVCTANDPRANELPRPLKHDTLNNLSTPHRRAQKSPLERKISDQTNCDRGW